MVSEVGPVHATGGGESDDLGRSRSDCANTALMTHQLYEAAHLAHHARFI